METTTLFNVVSDNMADTLTEYAGIAQLSQNYLYS